MARNIQEVAKSQMTHASAALLRAMLGQPPEVTIWYMQNPDIPICDQDPHGEVVSAIKVEFQKTKRNLIEDTRVVTCPRCLVLMDAALSGQKMPTSVAARIGVIYWASFNRPRFLP